MIEIWKEIPGYEGYYEISTLGVVRGIERKVKRGVTERYAPGGILATRINNWGYVQVRLSKDGVTTTTFIHRLLALTYISNPLNKKFINHKNANKTDNRLENLEWVTHSENMQHAFDNDLLKVKCKPVIDICSGQIFTSAKEASIYSGINQNTLKAYLNGHIKKNPTCMEYKYA